jgi:Ca2+-binding RTX toxin-like protein
MKSGRSSFWPRGRVTGAAALVLALSGLTLAAPWGAQPSSVSAAPGEVLILADTVTGGATSTLAQKFELAGKTPVVVDSATWESMTAAQFDSYDAIVLGDPTCGGIAPPAAEANAAVWSSVVDGNVVIIGTDETWHEVQGGAALMEKAAAFSVAESGKTGAYISLSCYYHGRDPGTPVPLLDGFGNFTATGVGCFNDAHIVATHAALSGLTDDTLSNWSCSVHEAFDAWPVSFEVLAIAEGIGAVYTAPDGTVGTPYILARGVDVISDIDLSPPTATNDVGTSHTVTATVKTSDPAPETPVVGTTVTFTVVDGPHADTTGTATTDASGRASFSYTGTAVGTDTIEATFVDALGRTQRSNRVTKTWTSGPPSGECLNYPDFSSTAGLNLGGNAATVGNVLRLTPAQGGQSGTAWAAGRVQVGAGFTSDFGFRFTDPGGIGAADGITFAIQDSSATATGSVGGSLGYEGIAHSLVVEFDTFSNPEYGDPDNNHIAIHSGGTGPNGPGGSTLLGSASLGGDPVLSDGNSHHARVRYDGGTLEVFVDDMSAPKLTTAVDLDALLGLSGGDAWAGFTSATGSGFENHDLLNWTLCPSDAVSAVPDSADTDEDVPVEIFVLTNDPAPPGVGLWEITGVTQPAGQPGTVTINDEADPEVEDTVVYTPPLNFFGMITFTYTVDDGAGHTATAGVMVMVGPINDEPVVHPGPDKSTVEGAAVAVTGSATDVDGPFPLSYHWVILDGPEVTEEPNGTFADENNATTQFTPKQDGTYILQLEACDADDLCDTDAADDTVEVTVANVAPTVTLPADRTVVAGVSTSVAVTFTDPGGDDTHTAVIDWGDGSTETTVDPAVSGFSRTHTFAATGTRTVEACVSDDDDTTCDTMMITVVAPTTLKIADASITEPDSGTASMTFTITATPVPTATATVVAKTVNGSATAPSDFTALPAAGQTVTFAAGQATRPVTVPIVGDLLREPNESFTVALSAPVGATIADGSGLGRIRNNDDCTVLGTAAGETLTGTAGNDVICGLGGNDTINGLAGNDTILGGDGNDAIRGGAGNDTLRGQNGDDTLTGEAGNDVIEGGAGVDEASWVGAPNAVTVDLTANTASGWGTDTLATLERARGGSFGDTLRGNGLRNSLWGGDGNDTLLGRSSDDTLDGQNGNDTLRGEAGNDTALGGAGDDRVDGGAGVDLVKGDAGNDQVSGGAGNDNSPSGTTAGVIGGSGTNSLNGGLGTDYCSRGTGDTRTSCERP